MGDYASGALADIMDKPKLHGDIVEHWKKHCAGVRTVGFAVNVKHSQHIVQAFVDAGIPAAHLDGETPAA
jgi:superfamily II DNA or RNA helicase